MDYAYLCTPSFPTSQFNMDIWPRPIHYLSFHSFFFSLVPISAGQILKVYVCACMHACACVCVCVCV